MFRSPLPRAGVAARPYAENLSIHATSGNQRHHNRQTQSPEPANTFEANLNQNKENYFTGIASKTTTSNGPSSMTSGVPASQVRLWMR